MSLACCNLEIFALLTLSPPSLWPIFPSDNPPHSLTSHVMRMAARAPAFPSPPAPRAAGTRSSATLAAAARSDRLRAPAVPFAGGAAAAGDWTAAAESQRLAASRSAAAAAPASVAAITVSAKTRADLLQEWSNVLADSSKPDFTCQKSRDMLRDPEKFVRDMHAAAAGDRQEVKMGGQRMAAPHMFVFQECYLKLLLSANSSQWKQLLKANCLGACRRWLCVGQASKREQLVSHRDTMLQSVPHPFIPPTSNSACCPRHL